MNLKIPSQIFFAQIVNFGNDIVNLKISVAGLENAVNSVGSTSTVLNSSNLMDENSFEEPIKVRT